MQMVCTNPHCVLEGEVVTVLYSPEDDVACEECGEWLEEVEWDGEHSEYRDSVGAEPWEDDL